MRAPNKNGPRKLKSWPLFAAQNVYTVRLSTTAVVNMTDSNITLPVTSKQRDVLLSSYDTPVEVSIIIQREKLATHDNSKRRIDQVITLYFASYPAEKMTMLYHLINNNISVYKFYDDARIINKIHGMTNIEVVFVMLLASVEMLCSLRYLNLFFSNYLLSLTKCQVTLYNQDSSLEKISHFLISIT